MKRRSLFPSFLDKRNITKSSPDFPQNVLMSVGKHQGFPYLMCVTAREHVHVCVRAHACACVCGGELYLLYLNRLKIPPYLPSNRTSRKHAYIILTPLNPTFI